MRKRLGTVGKVSAGYSNSLTVCTQTRVHDVCPKVPVPRYGGRAKPSIASHATSMFNVFVFFMFFLSFSFEGEQDELSFSLFVR